MPKDFSRSLKFKDRQGPRYGWFNVAGTYVPYTFSYLTDSEWNLIDAWYSDTEDKKLIGESSVSFMSILQALIMGNNITRVVQLGHYSGYSTLLMGFMLRKMGVKHGLFSVDIDKMVSDYTEDWVKKAELEKQVKIHVEDSSHPDMPNLAKEYLGGDPQLVIIDSSHQYEHTLRELDLWYPALATGGILVMHDSSPMAESFDSTKRGGVRRALTEWLAVNKNINHLNLYPRFGAEKRSEDEEPIYKDPCGIAIIQK